MNYKDKYYKYKKKYLLLQEKIYYDNINKQKNYYTNNHNPRCSYYDNINKQKIYYTNNHNPRCSYYI